MQQYMKYLKDYIQNALADGKYFFTKDEILENLNLTKTQFKYQAYRLARSKSIVNLINGFYMIIPPEYRHLGSFPPHSIIDPLMKYLKEDYYIGLLSAAAFYGSAHQQPIIIEDRLKRFKTRIIDLRPDYQNDEAINYRWKVRVNDTLELEE